MRPRRGAIEGTGEVNLAIVLSTATTMVVFLPIILMSEDARPALRGLPGFPDRVTPHGEPEPGR
ncbi:MAG: efflux RND transporter permease subunit [Deltaproteobacteria bacterium]|nr:efflux RND transporter permease subunit [Deltaproteobacteria bacterium]